MDFSEIGNKLRRLRTEKGLSQEAFGEIAGVSRQTVQRWENGSATPEAGSLLQIAGRFGLSLDEFLLGRSPREREITREKSMATPIAPSYERMHSWEMYSANLKTELTQAIEEGKQAEEYRALFEAVGQLPAGEHRARLADGLFALLQDTPVREDYPYDEPSALPEILAARKPLPGLEEALTMPEDGTLREKLAGAWYGRIAGCLLGKPIEGIYRSELQWMLKKSGNFPMKRYILSTDITDEVVEHCRYPLRGGCYPDVIKNAPADDDTNYTVLYQRLIGRYGRDFTPFDVAAYWQSIQPKTAYCTAERVAFCNFIRGYQPPASAVYKNPFREWIGAQIRGDYFGYLNPCDPRTAAEMAWRDASISHVKNGIYGEMYIAAMLAVAAGCADIRTIVEGGLSFVPCGSRLYKAIRALLDGFDRGVSEEAFFADFHTRWQDTDPHHWCHTVSNAEIVTAALLYGGGDYSRSVGMAVEQGFDTDCNGATVGSILGMRGGIGSIGEEWTAPLQGKLATALVGQGMYEIDALVETTMKQIKG